MSLQDPNNGVTSVDVQTGLEVYLWHVARHKDCACVRASVSMRSFVTVHSLIPQHMSRTASEASEQNSHTRRRKLSLLLIPLRSACRSRSC